MLQKEHGSFSMVALSKIRAEKEEELSFERRMALQKMKEEEDFVYVRVFGKLMQLTKERYLKYHTDWKPLDKDGNEITIKQ